MANFRAALCYREFAKVGLRMGMTWVFNINLSLGHGLSLPLVV